jgi:hypothetical protein
MAKIKTEASWLQSTTPSSLLLTLKGKRLPRQRRLFSVACCRRSFADIPDPESRSAVEVAERFAEGQASGEELSAAYAAAQRIAMNRVVGIERLPAVEQPAAWDEWRLAHAAQLTCAPSGTEEASVDILKRAARRNAREEQEEKKAHSDLIRCIFGNPFRRLAVAPSLLTPTVRALAAAAYEDRDLPAGTLQPDRLAILADALEDAGCTDAILSHLRGPGPHVRGCHLLDALTGRS